MDLIKVIVVDDSAFMRKVLSDILNKDRRIEVIATARNGEDGFEKIKRLQPDVVTLDIEMPKMNGLQTLKKIMAESKVPVVMVSTLTKEGAQNTIQAMTLGAVDFIEKPSGAISLDMANLARTFIRKVVIASQSQPKQQLKDPRGKSRGTIDFAPTPPKPIKEREPIIAIGTSTGGPRALQNVLSTIPGNLPSPIVIVQHMPKGFTKSLAERLNKLSAIQVKEAEHKEVLQKGVAYIAPGGFHMRVVKNKGKIRIELDETEAIGGHRPSLNRLFSSLADLPHVHTISVVMTGMGADGTEGLLKLKDHQPWTYSIAEAEETCVVFGMPKSIIKSGLADQVQPLSSITESILLGLGSKRGK